MKDDVPDFAQLSVARTVGENQFAEAALAQHEHVIGNQRAGEPRIIVETACILSLHTVMMGEDEGGMSAENIATKSGAAICLRVWRPTETE